MITWVKNKLKSISNKHPSVESTQVADSATIEECETAVDDRVTGSATMMKKPDFELQASTSVADAGNISHVISNYEQDKKLDLQAICVSQMKELSDDDTTSVQKGVLSPEVIHALKSQLTIDMEDSDDLSSMD